MSDPITPSASPGQVPQAALVAAPAGAVRLPEPAGLRPEPAASPAQSAATAGAAAQLELSVAAKAAAPALASAAPKPMDVADAAKAFQDYLKNLPSDLQFEPDAASGIVIFKVINPITQEVLRQYPPEEMVAMARTIKDSLKKDASGILLDQHL